VSIGVPADNHHGSHLDSMRRRTPGGIGKVRWKWPAIPVIFLLLFCHGSRNGNALKPGTTIRAQISLPDGGNKERLRTLPILSVPKQYRAHTPCPMLVALHGYGDNAEALHDLWKPVTDSLGFVLLTPQGEIKVVEPISWGWGENSERVILASIDLAKKQVLLNLNKIFVTGFHSVARLAISGESNTRTYSPALLPWPPSLMTHSCRLTRLVLRECASILATGNETPTLAVLDKQPRA